jgi:isorenieratene synthase
MPDEPLLIGRAPRTEIATPSDRPDWIGADPAKIDRALRHALAKPSGGWCVVDGTRALGRGPRPYTIEGRELVGWRCANGPALAPDACPHMGAELSKGTVDAKGRVVCPWHGLALAGERRGSWAPLPTFDDGVLVWARFDSLLAPGEAPTPRPFLPARPERALDAVIRVEGNCAPEDVIANRLDPWHGAHFHGHSFARLSVIDEAIDHVTVRVVYRIAGRLGMEVDARFDCPDPRTIVMTIVSGEGVGSVVETHATPIAPGRTAIVEATLATSERTSIAWLPRAALLRPLIEARARRLWVDDVAYCERRFALRARG